MQKTMAHRECLQRLWLTESACKRRSAQEDMPEKLDKSARGTLDSPSRKGQLRDKLTRSTKQRDREATQERKTALPDKGTNRTSTRELGKIRETSAYARERMPESPR